jgi:hypothetical protein
MRPHRSANRSRRPRSAAIALGGKASRRRGEHGTGLTEYALGFALIAAVALTGVQRLNDAARHEATNQAECMSERPPPPSCARRAVSAPQAEAPGDPPAPDTP